MRVVVVGGSGNVGTSVLAALARDPSVHSIVALARRRPRARFAKTTWAVADVARDPLEPHLRGADVVVHLAWAIQPSRDPERLRATNVVGSERVFRAALASGARAIVYASSVGVYSPGPKDRRVDENWPTEGVATSSYSRHKVEVERMLDRLGSERPEVRVVRLRKALVFKREAGTEVRRYFLGPFFPASLAHPALLRVLPRLRGLRVQCVHGDDVGEAYRLAVTSAARGAFNLAAEPVLDADRLARRLSLPTGLVRAGTLLSWRLHLQPTPPGWLDLALAAPLLDTSRARRELGWTPRVDAEDALLALLAGLRGGAGLDTPPLSPESSGPFRVRELAGGVGRR
jgi:UDP-glucose 4-epimerase